MVRNACLKTIKDNEEENQRLKKTIERRRLERNQTAYHLFDLSERLGKAFYKIDRMEEELAWWMNEAVDWYSDGYNGPVSVYLDQTMKDWEASVKPTAQSGL